MLVHFKDGQEEEDCPLPEEIRQDLLKFHEDLLAHCGKERGSENPSPKLPLETSPEVSLRFPDPKHLWHWCYVMVG